MRLAPGISSSKREKKNRQVNVRFTPTEIESLKTIAQIEDRDVSYVISCFAYMGTKLYKQAGSLRLLRDLRIDKGGRASFKNILLKDTIDALKLAGNST